MNFINLVIGACSFLIIGIFHPIVIKTEFYFSKRCWPAFVLAGIIFAIPALLIDGYIGILFAIISFSCFWSIIELFEQDQRVKRGWFPAGKHHNAANAPEAIHTEEKT